VANVATPAPHRHDTACTAPYAIIQIPFFPY